jgi:hypothetical protein
MSAPTKQNTILPEAFIPLHQLQELLERKEYFFMTRPVTFTGELPASFSLAVEELKDDLGISPVSENGWFGCKKAAILP